MARTIISQRLALNINQAGTAVNHVIQGYRRYRIRAVQMTGTNGGLVLAVLNLSLSFQPGSGFLAAQGTVVAGNFFIALFGIGLGGSVVNQTFTTNLQQGLPDIWAENDGSLIVTLADSTGPVFSSGTVWLDTEL
jgi:hypothetical protein